MEISKNSLKCKLFRKSVIKNHDKLGLNSKILDESNFRANLNVVRPTAQLSVPKTMKLPRIPNLKQLEPSQAIDPFMRGIAQNSLTKIPGQLNSENLREKVLGELGEDEGVALRLKDEFSNSLINLVVRECREMISENSMTQENWKAIGEFLKNELGEFSQLKEELVRSERKSSLVQQKAIELSQKVSASSSSEKAGMKTSLMAHAMLLAETEMRRDHLAERVSMIIDQFTKRILADFAGRASHTSLELRLRAIFGTL